MHGDSARISHRSACLEIIDRLQHLDHIHGVRDHVDDVRERLVCHRRLVERALIHGCCIDIRHRLAELIHGERFLRRLARHDPSCSVRRGVVPVRRPASDSEDAAVTHIDGDEDALTRVRRDGAFAENPLLRVDVVMDGVKCLSRRESRPLEEDARDDLAVLPHERLTDLDVMQVVLKVAAIEVGEIGGDLRRFCASNERYSSMIAPCSSLRRPSSL